MSRNPFRDGRDGKLNRSYLRTCAVWRLIKAGRIASKSRAVALLNEVGVRHARQTVELWLTNSQFSHVSLAA